MIMKVRRGSPNLICICNSHYNGQMITAFLASFYHPKLTRSSASIGKDHIYLDSDEPNEYNQICIESLDDLL